MRIYHGSVNIIKVPEYGKGKPYNDYGLGFYCTENIEMAKEWSCNENQDGYANVYDIDLQQLHVLNLNTSAYTILHWLTLLVKNRSFRLHNLLAKDARQYLLSNFDVDTSHYDVIIGYRADDSYFSFAEDFLNNAISVKKLARAMHLGNLGEQIVLVSPKAFANINFIEAVSAPSAKYFQLKTKRDSEARQAYLTSDRKPSYASDELYMIDIMRQGVQPDDPRLQ